MVKLSSLICNLDVRLSHIYMHVSAIFTCTSEYHLDVRLRYTEMYI